MQNKRTFISFIGRGQIDKTAQDCYRQTTYDFGAGTVCSCRCFAEAVRKSEKFDFNEVIFIGTTTSSWSALLESCEEEEFELWSKLFDQEQAQKTLSEEDILKLQEILTVVWGKPVRVSVHAPELLDSNCAEIFNHYTAEIFSAGNDILLDITHSFRWMPLLLTSALQFKNAYSINEKSSKFEIIYGELGKNEKSPVRYVNELVNGQETADAIALFFQKFESELLTEKLSPYWPAGAKAITKFSNHIQGFYFLPLLIDTSTTGFKAGQPLNQLGNALKNFDPANSPAWVKEIYKQLQTIYTSLSVDSAPQRFINLAALFAERKLYGHAVLNICLATEQLLIMAYQTLYKYDKHPGYEKLQELKAAFTQKVGRHSTYDKLLFRIMIVRNQVAHGGLAKESFKNMQAGSLANQYEQMLKDYNKFEKFMQEEFKP